MRVIATVFKKEMIDTLRDRRALVLMIVLPLLLFPTIFKVMVSVEKRQAAKAEAKKLRVACIDQGNASRFVEMLKERNDVEIVHATRDNVTSMIHGDSLDGAFLFANTFDPPPEDFFFDEPLGSFPPPPNIRTSTATITTAAKVRKTMIAVNRIARGMLYSS